MTIYQPGDMLLVAFPFAGGTGAKQRPAVVVLDSGDADVVVARVTTQIYQTPNDVLISDWQSAGLLAPSVIRVHKLATIEKALVRRSLGRLQPTDLQRVAEALHQALHHW